MRHPDPKAVINVAAAYRLAAILLATLVASALPVAGQSSPDGSIDSIDYQVVNLPLPGPDGKLVHHLTLSISAKLSDGIEPLRDVASATLQTLLDVWTFRKPDSGAWGLFSGQWAGVQMQNVDRMGGTILPLGQLEMKVTLASGKVLERTIDVLPPGEVPSESYEYVTSESYEDFATPWQARALAAPVVTSANFGDKSIVIHFTIDDPRCANVFFEFIAADSKLVFRSNTVVDPFSGAGRSWFNGGKGLKTDGTDNVLVFDRTSLKGMNGYGIGDTASIQAIATDGLRYRGSATPSAYKYKSLSFPFRLRGTVAQSAPAVSADTKPTPPLAPRLESVDRPDRDYYRWLTGLSGILATTNGGEAEDLSPLPPPPEYAKLWNDLLRGAWQINSHDDLVAAVDSLLERGNNASWQSYHDAIRDNPGISDAEILAKIDGRPSQFRLDYVRARMNAPLGRDIHAWDYGRAAMLVRAGFACGYVGAEEAWSLLEKIGDRTRAEFSSWKDFGLNYIEGRVFWNGEEQAEGAKLFEEAQKAFVALMSPKGTWATTPWPQPEGASR